jgi:hypothetical protein
MDDGLDAPVSSFRTMAELRIAYERLQTAAQEARRHHNDECRALMHDHDEVTRGYRAQLAEARSVAALLEEARETLRALVSSRAERPARAVRLARTSVVRCADVSAVLTGPDGQAVVLIAGAGPAGASLQVGTPRPAVDILADLGWDAPAMEATEPATLVSPPAANPAVEAE